MSTTSSVPMESKSAKKRKAKAEAQALAAPATAGEQTPPADAAVNGTSGHDNVNGTENSYLKELSKNIRNLHKKLAGTAKADSVLEQNPGISIEDLVVQKKLNADQKAQLTKKPALQSQLAQYEEQHKHFQNFAQGLEDKHTRDKAALVESHEAALAQAKEEAAEAQAAKTSQSGQMEHGLKVITGFLHAAAAMRQNQDQESDEARAFEGALLLVYQGNTSSLDTLKSLVEGSDEKVPDVEGNSLDYTFAQIKEAALKDVTALVEDEDSGVADVEPPTVDVTEETTVDTGVETGTDPTVAHAGLTELEDNTAVALQANGDATPEVAVAPEQTSTTADAANAVAESSWDPQASITSTQTTTGEDWVQVPRDPAETENGNSQPAAQQSTSNWADEAGAAASEEKATPENDGFEQVRRDRGGRGRGGPRGRGGRGGDGRGRGRGRGHGRGRGRGAGTDRPAQES